MNLFLIFDHPEVSLMIIFDHAEVSHDVKMFS